MHALSLLMLFAVTPLVMAAIVLFVEIVVAASSKREVINFCGERRAVVVLVPAHNESRGILPTLADVRNQICQDDRLLVVADNCTDNTAEIARAAGAHVIERDDPQKLGKGYALDFGLRSLSDDDPEIVIAIDADCRLGKGTIDQLALACSSSGRPVQALYLMRPPKETNLNYSIAEFAWRIRNDLRPRGLQALGLPCQLMGTGMAFRRKDLDGIELATGHLTEDLDLGLQLAAAGRAPVFCPSALVTSEFPTSEEASITQRQRWEHGQLSILARRVLPYGWMALRNRNWQLFILSLDAAVPPLVLIGLLAVTAFLVSFFGWMAGVGSSPLVLSSLALIFLFLALCAAWATSGRDLLTWRSLSALIPYVASKLGIYSRVFGSNKKWVRTHRAESD
jgi:cellulose synthase/poly-beta-1,6-N-acetylglucosamine synthase-like glycosyltransferase